MSIEATHEMTLLRTLRKDRLTDEERMEALWNRQKPDRVPILGISLGFSTLNVGYSIADAFIDAKKSADAQRWTNEQYGWQPIIWGCGSHSAFPAEEFGGEIKWPDTESMQAPVVARYAVDTNEDILNLEVPHNLEKVGTIPMLLENAAYMLKWKCVVIAPTFYGPLDTAVSVIGIERTLRLLVKNPDLLHHAFRVFTDFKIALAKLFADVFGADRLVPEISGPMEANSIISPKHFEELCLPYIKELQESMREMGYKHMWFHPCGDQNANLPYWSQCDFGDPAIVSVGHEIDLNTVAEYFPDDIACGNLEPSIVQVQAAESIYQASKEIILKGKGVPGGFMFSTGCEMPPKAPPYNVWVLTKAINDFGWYE